VAFSSVKPGVEKLRRLIASNARFSELLEGFLAFNKKFKQKRRSSKSSSAVDV
jgi:hypothetical protein